MLSAKLATLGLLKLIVAWNKDCGNMIFVHDVTSKFYHVTQSALYNWSYDQNLVILAFLWQKLS